MTSKEIPQYMIEEVRHLYSSIYEGKKVDQDQDGDNDFADIQIARMIASGVSKKEAILRTRKKAYNKESYDLDQLSILYLVKEGYAKDLRSAQVIYENASSGFKRELNEIAPALVALAARALPSAGRLLASSTGKSLMSKGKNILKDPRVRQLGKYALDQISSNKNGEDASNDDSSNSTNSGLLSGFLRSATGATMNASYNYGETDELEESFYNWVDDLFEDGYDLSNYTWEGLFEYYCDLLSEVTGKESLMSRQLKPSPTAPKPALTPAPGPGPGPGPGAPTPTGTTGTTPNSSSIPSKSTTSVTNLNSANPSGTNKIKLGMTTYNAQRKAGDFSGARDTGMEIWKRANPRLSMANSLRQDTTSNSDFGRARINRLLYNKGPPMNPGKSGKPDTPQNVFFNPFNR